MHVNVWVWMGVVRAHGVCRGKGEGSMPLALEQQRGGAVKNRGGGGHAEQPAARRRLTASTTTSPDSSVDCGWGEGSGWPSDHSRRWEWCECWWCSRDGDRDRDAEAAENRDGGEGTTGGRSGSSMQQHNT